VQEMQEPARARGLRLHVLNASTEHELDIAFAAIPQTGAGALIIPTDPLFSGRREQIAALAMRHAIPAIFAEREAVVAGGLMSYAASQVDSFRQVGIYVGRILKGAKPADLPVVQADKFELVINAQTARMLGITVPAGPLARADEVIE
jgi:putative ABC transport system substrate-binding protein